VDKGIAPLGLARPRAPIPWHPVGFVVGYVMYAYVVTSVSPYAMFRGLIVAVATTLVAMGLASLAFRNARRGALIATALVAFVVFGREMAKILGNAASLLPLWQSAAFGLAIIAALGLVTRIAWSSLRLPDGLARWTRGLNGLATILLMVVLVAAVTSGTPAQTIADLRQGMPLDAAPDRVGVSREGPDIYLILLDGHARRDVLADRFGFDVRPFLNALEDRGFDVASASHSNYLLTQLTLTSMLQMALLDDVPELEPVIAGVAGNATARRALNDNPTFAFLRSRGYTTVAFGTPSEDVTLRQADVFIDSSQLTDFEWQLIGSTFLLDALGLLAPDLYASLQRARINSAFANVVAVARDADLGPRFVFAHVMAPHTPLVFGRHGEPLEVPILRRTDDTAAGLGLSDGEFANRFIGQTAYVDDRALGAIDGILAASPDPPIIIVMSDHGSRSRPFDPKSAGNEDLRERFGTLFAAYTPGRSGVFPSSVTPAEVMVDLLNAYFDAALPQPERGTFASKAADPFRLTRVSEPPPPN
jgi:hypothetical protein